MKTLFVIMFAIGTTVNSVAADLTEENLADVRVWSCMPDAPGGGLEIDVENKVICDFGSSGVGECRQEDTFGPNSPKKYTIQKVFVGKIHFAKGVDIPFIEYVGMRKNDVQVFKFYGSELNYDAHLAYRAEGFPRYSYPAVTDPRKAFEPFSNELRCWPKK